MKKKLWRLTVAGDFSAAHALRHYEGKCERLHGHNYQVELVVQGEILDKKTHMLMDFKDLKAILKETLEEFDHSLLNDRPPFDSINPSAENLSKVFWQRIEAKLPKGITLFSVSVAEKDGQSATYMEFEA